MKAPVRIINLEVIMSIILSANHNNLCQVQVCMIPESASNSQTLFTQALQLYVSHKTSRVVWYLGYIPYGMQPVLTTAGRNAGDQGWGANQFTTDLAPSRIQTELEVWVTCLCSLKVSWSEKHLS